MPTKIYKITKASLSTTGSHFHSYFISKVREGQLSALSRVTKRVNVALALKGLDPCLAVISSLWLSKNKKLAINSLAFSTYLGI